MLKPSKDDPNYAEQMKEYEKDKSTWGQDVQKNEKFVPKEEPKK